VGPFQNAASISVEMPRDGTSYSCPLTPSPTTTGNTPHHHLPHAVLRHASAEPRESPPVPASDCLGRSQSARWSPWLSWSKRRAISRCPATNAQGEIRQVNADRPSLARAHACPHGRRRLARLQIVRKAMVVYSRSAAAGTIEWIVAGNGPWSTSSGARQTNRQQKRGCNSPSGRSIERCAFFHHS
jgi:hypothetical protein